MNFTGLIGETVTASSGTQGLVVGWENDQLIILQPGGALAKVFYWDVTVDGTPSFKGAPIG